MEPRCSLACLQESATDPQYSFTASHGFVPCTRISLLWPSTVCLSRFFFSHGSTTPSGPRLPLWDSLIKLSHTTLGRTLPDEWSAHRRDLYVTKHNSHKRWNPYSEGIRTRNPRHRAAVEPRFRPHGQMYFKYSLFIFIR